jgi:hypothetical protein
VAISELQPWQKWFKDRDGMNENNPADSILLSKGWQYTSSATSYFTTVKGDDYAWCGMSLATALAENGFAYPKQAEAAFSYIAYGEEIDLTAGAIVIIQHVDKSYHVTTFCRWKDEAKQIGLFLGGNQEHQIMTKEFNVSGHGKGNDKIYAVRWPVKILS